MASTFLSLENVPIDRKYVVYCDASVDTIYLVNDVFDETLRNTPLMEEYVNDMRHDLELNSSEPLKIVVWTRPFKQDDYPEYLNQYARLTTGKGCDYDEGVMNKNGWTEHTFHLTIAAAPKYKLESP